MGGVEIEVEVEVVHAIEYGLAIGFVIEPVIGIGAAFARASV